MLDLSKLTDDDKKARERFHEIVDLFEEALFWTFRAAYERGSGSKTARQLGPTRNRSVEAWHEVADEVIAFALEED